MSITTTDRAAQIRAAYKAKGWTSRDVSVKSHGYSMGSSINVKVKNPAVSIADARAIAEGHEKIDRDQWGEILSGGNRYVFVSYSSDAEAAIITRYADVLMAAAADVDAGSQSTLHPIGDTGFLMGRGSNGWGYSLWKDSHIQTSNDALNLATSLHAREAL